MPAILVIYLLLSFILKQELYLQSITQKELTTHNGYWEIGVELLQSLQNLEDSLQN